MSGLTSLQNFLAFFLMGSAIGFIISIRAFFNLLSGEWEWCKEGWWFVFVIVMWPALFIYLLVSTNVS